MAYHLTRWIYCVRHVARKQSSDGTLSEDETIAEDQAPCNCPSSLGCMAAKLAVAGIDSDKFPHLCGVLRPQYNQFPIRRCFRGVLRFQRRDGPLQFLFKRSSCSLTRMYTFPMWVAVYAVAFVGEGRCRNHPPCRSAQIGPAGAFLALRGKRPLANRFQHQFSAHIHSTQYNFGVSQRGKVVSQK